MVDDIANNVVELSFTVVVFEVNMVRSNPTKWWIDISATKHVCLTNKCSLLFSQFRMGICYSWVTWLLL